MLPKNKAMLILMLTLVATALGGLLTHPANAHHMEGKIYCDNNQNGYIDDGDSTLEGVCIRVESTDEGGVDETDCTDANGDYYIELPSLRPRHYKASLDPTTLPPDSTFIIPSTNEHFFSIVDGDVVEIFDWLIDSPVCQTSLGDRVWEDLDGDGIQNCEDTNHNGILGDIDPAAPNNPDLSDQGAECGAGIPGVTVKLLQGNCETPVAGVDPTTTDDQGFYLFEDLDPGEYCVFFDLDTVDVCDFGAPQFTKKNIGDDDKDSDADPATGVTGGITLAEGQTDRTWDAGIVCPGPARLGDRVWEDRNGDGIQDCTDTNNNGILGDIDPAAPNDPTKSDQGVECDAGIPDVSVELRQGDCLTPVDGVLPTTTDDQGFYLFENLDPGEYCVFFDLDTVDVCDFGAPQFTKKNIGDDDKDSDADPATGVTGGITLAEGQTDRTWDAGIVCPGPARLGDRVWEDRNGDGIQDCTDTNNNGILGDIDPAAPNDPTKSDQGVECDAGIPDVSVELRQGDCLTPVDGVLPTTTDDQGFYLFENLTPGDYCVFFDLDTVPADVCDFVAPQFTLRNQGGDDAKDSDADPVSGVTGSILLGEGQTDRTWDAGIVCLDCAIAIDKKCSVVQPSSGPFDCSDAKPIDSLTMNWDGTASVRIKAYKGSVGSTLLQDIDNITPGDEVTVSGMGGSPNDQYWEIFNAGTDTKIGESKFHISCSDRDMNGPEDCGKNQGNGKDDNGGFVNDWLFEGMAGDLTLDCTPGDLTFTDQCTFEAAPVPGCKTDPEVNDLTSITFRYTGADCSASSNNQDDGKWDCEGVPGADPVSITVIKDAGKTSSDKDSVNEGETFTLSDDFSSESIVEVGDQTLTFHTSCSQPLAVGDMFGSLEVVGINGLSPGAEVTYFYEVKNIGDINVDVTSVFDDQLGELLDNPPVQLASDKSFTLNETAFISETTTNKVTAKANLFATEIECGEAMDKVKVTVTEPTCDVSIVFDKLEDDKIKWKITNTGAIVATLKTFVLDFPASYGVIKEIKIDGAIYKASESSLVVGPGVPITETDWTQSDVSKRQLDPGETRTLEGVFTEKGDRGAWTDITDLGGLTFKETCDVEFPDVGGCALGKPTKLVFEYTGDLCSATTNSQEGNFKCEETGALGSLVSVEMTKDANKFSVAVNGNEVTIAYDDPPGEKMPSEIKYRITGSTGKTQSQTLHTSCSKALNVDDQFGALILRKFVPEN